AATGLTYMQQRYYDPLIGRFLSVDPVTPYSMSGANFNRYWYANNNPYKFTDPDGRSACPGSTKTACIQSDTYVESRTTGQTTQASDSVAKAMISQKSVVAVPSGSQKEKIGFVTPAEGGGHKVTLASDATTARTARTDSAEATIPKGAEAVIHGHINGRTDGVISPADAAPLKHGLPNGVVSEGRVGVTEIVGGRLQFRMLDGRMTQREAKELQKSLDRQQLQPEFMNPEATQ
ncbi:MAG: RHS repeat-associated core domain-containing protein, partial [Prosthecobacter sp.]|nr:RHS repeat-associated core domain-containing protein [Prosthecobacter sp.]